MLFLIDIYIGHVIRIFRRGSFDIAVVQDISPLDITSGVSRFSDGYTEFPLVDKWHVECPD